MCWPTLLAWCRTQRQSTPGFFPSASPVMSRLISSFTCQLISIIITTLIIHHSFTLSLQALNLPFQQILPTLDFFYLPDCLHDNGTGPDLSCSSLYFSFTFYFFCCFMWWTKLATRHLLLHVKYTLSYRIRIVFTSSTRKLLF